MAKESGLGANAYVDGVDLSGDTNALSKISRTLEALDFTGIDKFAYERLPGQLDAGIDWDSFYNPTGAHPVLSTLPRTDRVVSYVHKAAVLGTPVANIVAKQMTYDPTRPEDGRMMIKVSTLANAFWLDWSRSLTTGKRTAAGAENGTGVDFQIQGAPANFGAQLYLHVFAFTGTSVTITVQDSADNVSFANLTGGTFAVVSTAPQAQRIQTGRTQAVRRYLRYIISGTFTNLVFQMSATVNTTEYTI